MTDYPESSKDLQGAAPAPTGRWGNRVSFSKAGGGFAYRPGQLIAVGEQAKQAAIALGARLATTPPTARPILRDEFLISFDPETDIDIEFTVAELRHQGLAVEFDYVLFNHSTCGCGCASQGGPHANPVFSNPVFSNPVFSNPVFSNPVFSNPVFSNPVFSNPVFSNPVFSNPVFSNPVFSNPVFSNAELREEGVRSSTAVPAEAPEMQRPIVLPNGPQRVIVIDTGIAEPGTVDGLPDFLAQSGNYGVVAPADVDRADADLDTFLDPASGHGTFIAGIIEQLAPGREVHVRSALTSFGDGAVSEIADVLLKLITDGLVHDHTVINLSFGGYADREMATLARAIRQVQRAGAVVVASAGNDGICRHSYPACLPDVVSVGSIGPYGPEPYSNHGNWVRACAPGTDVVSSFFKKFDGSKLAARTAGALDPDEFAEWASWTGTSFSAPIVAGALVRYMACTGYNAKSAVERMIFAPGLLQMPGLGTVVNLRPGM